MRVLEGTVAEAGLEGIYAPLLASAIACPCRLCCFENAGPEVQLIEQRLEGGAHSPFPLLRCRNVYVLPGVPALLQVLYCVHSSAAAAARVCTVELRGVDPRIPPPPLPAHHSLSPCPLQKKWRAVEAHLQANAPQQAPFQTALLRLRLRDETQVRRRCS